MTEWQSRPAGVAAYVRVSSRAQDYATQKDAIERAALARGDVITHWFQETRSGKVLDRPKLAELQACAQRGELVKVYVFRVDRLTRRGIRDTLSIVEALRQCGCVVASVADGFALDGPAGDVILAVMAWAAQMERQALGDRISAARERVEAAGGRWGRPRSIDPGTLARARQMVTEGLTQREIAVVLKIKKATLWRALAQKGHYARTSPKPA